MTTPSRAALLWEIERLRRDRNTWELVALAGLITKLDAATAARVGDRMREIVFGKVGGDPRAATSTGLALRPD